MSEKHSHQNGPVGCFLVHGFTDSPNEMTVLDKWLERKISPFIFLPGARENSIPTHAMLLSPGKSKLLST